MSRCAHSVRGRVPRCFVVLGVFVGRQDVDLSDDWCDYDEAGDLSVQIMEFATEFKVLNEGKKGKKPSW